MARSIIDLLSSVFGRRHAPRPKEELEVRVGTIAGNEYEFHHDRIIQKTGPEGGRWLALADSHGYTHILKRLCEDGMQKGIIGIIHLGDFAQVIREKYDKSKSDFDEIRDGMEVIAEFGLPFLFHAGNQDYQDPYRRAVINIMERFTNAMDMSDISGMNIFEGRGYNFVFNHWGNDFTYVSPPVGYKETNNEINRIAENADAIRTGKDKRGNHIAAGNNNPIILCTHPPRQGRGRRGIDLSLRKTIQNGERAINWNMEQAGIKRSIEAHLSENGGLAVDDDFNFVKQGIFADSLHVSTGAASPWQYLRKDLNRDEIKEGREDDRDWGGKCYEGMAIIFEIKEGLVSFEPIYLDECELDENYIIRKAKS